MKNWLKDRNNQILILLFIIAISLFKIAFSGINTYSAIQTEENNPVEISTDATIHTSSSDPITVEKY